MDALSSLARERGLRLIEDVAQADGASYKGRRLGTIGDAGCFSLQFNKIITCGEGGMVITDDDALHTRVLMLQDVVGGQRNKIPPDQILLGMNFRMPELTAAVALVQLGRLDGLLEAMRARKQVLRAGMAESLAAAGGSFRTLHDPAGDAAIALVFYLPTPAQAEWVCVALEAEQIGASTLYSPDSVDYHVYAHWQPIMNQRTWSERGGPWRWGEPPAYAPDMCPRTLDLCGRAVHLDVNPLLDMDEIEETLAGLNRVLRAAPSRA
jgi:dTDP-4-amino-4,6-dideoxygalactose transaminase